MAIKLPVSALLDSKEKTAKLRQRLVDKTDHLLELSPPHDLDLFCFCYNKDNNQLDFISPVSEHMLNDNLSIMHSSEDPDGIGVMDDEDILVRLSNVT